VVGSVTAPAASAVAADSASAAASTQSHHRDDKTDPVLMFAADGMRQDLIEKYIDERRGALPGFADLLRHGASASGGGMLTQAPPNTGAGWYTMATGAWPGVTGSTNNTFHINTQPLGQSTAAFGTDVEIGASTSCAVDMGMDCLPGSPVTASATTSGCSAPQPSLMFTPSGSALMAVTSAPSLDNNAGATADADPFAQSTTIRIPSSVASEAPTRWSTYRSRASPAGRASPRSAASGAG